MLTKKNVPHIFVITTIFFFIGFITFFTFTNNAIVSLIPKQETLTELYFIDSANLPSSVANFSNQQVSFAIHNLENKNMIYKYDVYILSLGKKQNILSKVIPVKNSEQKIIAISFRTAIVHSKDKLVVVLNNNQSIDFLLKT